MKPLASITMRSVGGFLSWWGLELRATLEALRSHLAPRWRRSLTVFVSRSRLQVVDGDPRSGATVLDLSRPEPGSEPAFPLSDEQRATLSHGRRARLVFDTDIAFVRPLQMPVAALAHLDSAIELQKPKLLPLDANLLRTDFEVIAVDQPTATVAIELATLRRADIEPVEKTVEQWGLQLGEIQLGRPDDPRFRFKFGASATRAGRFAVSRADGFWAASAVALAFCAIAVFTVQAVRAQKSLTQALAETGAPAAAVLEQRQELIARLETLSLIAEAERAPTASSVLAEVTTRLTHDTWLSLFELKGRDLRIVGVSPEPAAVVKELANSALVTDVELRSSMSTGTNTGKDRFEIVAHVRGGT
jgi:hypothetical protein